MRALLFSIIIVSITFLLSAQDAGRGGQRVGGTAPAPPVMTMTIPGFPDSSQIPVKFSQAAPGVAVGEGTSPAMNWANVPTGTQGFFLHMHDMDLDRNKTTDDQAHWVLWNIPATATGLPEGVPKGLQLSDQRHRTHVPRSGSRCERSVPPLRV
jgi:phosphatidylethanolamine-binding protein (PEBP) family uncharacterized protein